jgi:hypothetical protein
MVTAPIDPAFYADLIAFGQRVGVRPEDALFVWASETGLRTDLSGATRTFASLSKPLAVPAVMPESVWERLPTLSAREQLPYVEAAVFSPARKLIGGRAFRNAFEVYLATLAPGLLRPDGRYAVETPLYVGKNYPDNWTMDNFPEGAPAYQSWIRDAAARSERDLSLRAAYPVALDLIARGVLKGFVSLGDLRNFAERVNPARDAALGQALTALDAARGTPGASVQYVLDLDAGFSGLADLRAPSPNEARSMMPTGQRGWALPLDAKWIFVTGLGLGILGIGIALHKRTRV